MTSQQKNKRSTSFSSKRNNPKHKNPIFTLRKALSTMPMADVTEQLIDQMIATKNNEEFLKRTSYFFKK